VQKNNLSVCTKIAIQLNCKLGGAPWLVTIPKKVFEILLNDSEYIVITFITFMFCLGDDDSWF